MGHPRKWEREWELQTGETDRDRENGETRDRRNG